MLADQTGSSAHWGAVHEPDQKSWPTHHCQFSAGFLILVFVLPPLLAQQTTYPRNATSCDQCHSVPSKFGSSQLTVTRVLLLNAHGAIPGAEGGIHHRAGGTDYATPGKKITGDRVTLNLLGDGFIEAIDEADILRNLDKERSSGLAINGLGARSPALEAKISRKNVGRFGWKSQHSSLLSACADSMRNELGIRNRLFPDEYSSHDPKNGPTPFDTPDAKTGKTELDRLVDDIRHTEPPARDPQLIASPDVGAGEKLFSQIGCAFCHVPSYKTLPAGTPINGGTYRIPAQLGGKVIHPYSDFLLHDVGTGDGIPQAAKQEFLDQPTANKFRTAPLWGLRFRSWMMHDGKSVTYHHAIMRHGGEATKVRERYEALAPVEKEELRAFLNSL